ncbi:hypothetical protein [Micromonospora haikouensis]|uniref:hypothetical protein n=1 Tax=Micromonospora haikouensis TaxID=686309 RepID=UPI003D7571FA
MFTVEQLNSVQHVASRTNQHVALKQNPLRREHLQGFVDCYLPGKDRSERAGTGRAMEVADKALETGAEVVDAAERLGSATFDLARTATGKVSSLITDRASGQRRGGER